MSTSSSELNNADKNVAIPWDDLIAAGNLKTLLQAIVQRLDRHDTAIANKISGGDVNDGDSGLVVISARELGQLQNRLAVVENTQLQKKLADVGVEKSLSDIAAEGQSQFSLAKHVIPLSQLKKRVEACESTNEVQAHAVDELNARLVETTQVLHDTLQRELAKMVTKDEFKVLEDKHEKLQKQVDRLEKDLVERLERMIKEVQAQVDILKDRMDNVDEKIEQCMDALEDVRTTVKAVHERVQEVEGILPTKADRSELEAAIQEIRDELEAMNIEEIMAMAEKANQRIDLMDERVDGMEDDVRNLREYVEKKQQELEDLQLEKQIENLRRELEEAKTGVFMKATARMDDMQAETDEIKAVMADTQGNVQINRENIEELETALREAGASINTGSKGGGTKALVERLQADVAALQERYADAAAREAQGLESAEKTENLVSEIHSKMTELANAKADKEAVDLALQVKADKDAVARDTEANQRAVDTALSTMNAGTQGIQQLLERQEGQVLDLEEKFKGKPDRDELDRLAEKLSAVLPAAGAAGGAGGPSQLEQAEAMYGAYGVTGDEAAVMSKPLGKFACLTCHRPIQPNYTLPMPALPLLPNARKNNVVQTAYVPQGNAGTRLPPMVRSDNGDSVVDVSELTTPRAVGGAHTQTRRDRPRTALLQTLQDGAPPRQREVVGDDNRVYYGRDVPKRRLGSGSSHGAPQP